VLDRAISPESPLAVRRPRTPVSACDIRRRRSRVVRRAAEWTAARWPAAAIGAGSRHVKEHQEQSIMNRPTAAGSSGTPFTVRVATWSARHRWPVVAAWFVFTFGLFGLSMAMGGTKTISQMDGGTARTESARADEVFRAGGSVAPHEDLYLVIRSSTMKTTDPAFRTAVLAITDRLRAVTDPTGQPAIVSVVDPFSVPAAAPLFSADGSSVQLVGTVTGEGEAVAAKVAAIRPVLDDIRSANPELEIRSLNNTMINEDLNKLVGDDMDGSLKITASSQDVGAVEESLPVRLDGEEAEIAFNARYVLDMLDAVDSSEIAIELSGPLNSGALKPVGDDSYLYVLMPMQIM
jgi:hypothetical protein